jgi:hypothetical protein
MNYAQSSEEATPWNRRFAAGSNNLAAVSDPEERDIVARTFSHVRKP